MLGGVSTFYKFIDLFSFFIFFTSQLTIAKYTPLKMLKKIAYDKKHNIILPHFLTKPPGKRGGLLVRHCIYDIILKS